jgi:hypothetical protein
VSNCKNICANCDNSFMGYGESSMDYRLRCYEKEMAVNDNDTCNMFELSARLKIQQLQAKIKKQEKIIELLKESNEFYANSKNWESIVGHTRWMSNLSIEDCALLNCGGGRARVAIKKVEEIENERF